MFEKVCLKRAEKVCNSVYSSEYRRVYLSRFGPIRPAMLLNVTQLDYSNRLDHYTKLFIGGLTILIHSLTQWTSKKVNIIYNCVYCM